MRAPDRPGAHRDLSGSEAREQFTAPISGPISLAPSDNELFATAVADAGGTLAPLSDATRGLIWLSEKRADELTEILERYPQIGWVQLPWAGVDGFRSLFATLNHDTAPLFTSAKGTYSEPVAEHALTLTLALLRELPRKAREPHWQTARTGLSLYGNHVVIIGAGGIVTELLRIIEPFRVTTTVVRRRSIPMPGATATVTVDHLSEVLPSADVVIVAAAATDDTDSLIGENEISLLPHHAVLVNIARGSLVDSDALAVALRGERLWGAGLDVTNPEPLPEAHPLWLEPRCIITSHSADTPLMTAHLLADRIRTNVAAFHGEGTWKGVVDTRHGY